MCTRSADRPASRQMVCRLAAIALSLVAAQAVAHAQGYPTRFEFGAAATEQEISAVAIAVPADGAGLPPGSGDYSRGKAVYETHCAAWPVCRICPRAGSCALSAAAARWPRRTR